MVTASYLRKKRGKAPAGKRWASNSMFIPGGPNANVPPSRVRNPKVAAQINAMFEKWWTAKQAREAA